MPVDDEHADEPWKMSPSRRSAPRRIDAAIPQSIRIVIADQIYIDRAGLPPPLIAQLIRLAAFQNPEFYRAQAMRMPTFGKPRVVSCAELYMRSMLRYPEAASMRLSIFSKATVPLRSWMIVARLACRYLRTFASEANCDNRSRGHSMLSPATTMACLPRQPHLARPLLQQR
ncbi:hypothetical protein [Bradyrhizobium sp. BR 1433]|uniref:hypothetical protein n=1 Tax=Bradyrhizobium sp. BR 1433 TaxID=3447967 RepID=UPI003EE6C0F3